MAHVDQGRLPLGLRASAGRACLGLHVVGVSCRVDHNRRSFEFDALADERARLMPAYTLLCLLVLTRAYSKRLPSCGGSTGITLMPFPLLEVKRLSVDLCPGCAYATLDVCIC